MRDTSFDASASGILDKIIWYMRISAIRKHLPATGGTVVDLGCGHKAPFLQRLLTLGYTHHAVGVDVAPDTSSAVPGLSCVQGNLNEVLPLPDAYADIVLSLAVIEHLDEPLVHVREAYRILKPKGVLLLTTPSPLGKPLLEFLAFRLGVIDRHEIEDHRRYFTGAMLKEALEGVGFAPSAVHARTFQLGMNNIVVARK